MKEKLLKLLEETVVYYSEDPENRRCVSEGGGCYYSPISANKPYSEGCAVGRIIKDYPDIQRVFDHADFKAIQDIFKDSSLEIPSELKQYPVLFLAKLQLLHDSRHCWDINGLTPEGIGYVMGIKEYINELQDVETPA